MRGFDKSRAWLLTLILIQILLLIETLTSHRIPAGHDGFQYFGLQYFFLNNAVNGHEIPQWMPFMTQGTVATWWYAVSTSLMQGVYFLIAPFLKAYYFSDLFAVGIFVDHLLLILGCWLWSGFYLRFAWVRFICCIAISLTTAWWLQPWHNFHSYFALPMIFYLLHMWRQWGRWFYMLLAGSLLTLQTLGQMPYALPFTVFVIAVYTLLLIVGGKDNHYGRLRITNESYGFFACVIVGIILLGCLVIVLSNGTSEIVNYNMGRLNDGRTQLDTFLYYGGNTHLARLKESWVGLSPEMDYTIYGGLWIMPFIVWGLLFIRERKWWLLAFLTALMIDFSHAGLSAKLIYYCWPGMPYFRHTALMVVMAKIFIILMASISLEAWLKPQAKQRWFIIIVAVIIGCGQLAIDRDVYDQLMISMTDWGRARLWYFEDLYKPLLNDRLLILKLLSGAYVFILAWLCFSKAWWRRFALMFFILLVSLDVGLYYFYETSSRSFNAGQYLKAFRFTPMPYAKRRINHDEPDNPREQLIQALPIVHHPHWTNETFSMTDRIDHPGRTDHWLKSFDRLLRVYWRMPDADFRKKSKDINLEVAFKFPLNHPAAQVWSGYAADKLMMFSKVARCPDQSTVAFFMTHGDYRGYLPFIVDHGSMFACLENLMADRRVPFDYDIMRFDANHLWVIVDSAKSGWLSFSDVWHPQWKASVDDIQVPVAKVNLAYKMVALEQGRHIVKFDYVDKTVAFAQQVLAVIALVWLIVMLLIIGRELA